METEENCAYQQYNIYMLVFFYILKGLYIKYYSNKYTFDIWLIKVTCWSLCLQVVKSNTFASTV